MPTLFDSHAEFNEWFSKDIENRAEKKAGISESELLPLMSVALFILSVFSLCCIKYPMSSLMSIKHLPLGICV